MTIRNQVAKLELLAVRRSGRRSVVAISIGRPYEIHDGRGANRAACSISVRGLGPHRYNPRRILGEDTFQALSITLAFVRLRLRDFVRDRKSTRLNSSHSQISYAVFCLKKKKKTYNIANSSCHSVIE